MLRRHILKRIAGAGAGLALAALPGLSAPALAQETVKIGLVLPMTGASASTGRQIEAAARLYMSQNGNKVAGKTIELIVKDDTGAADQTKRLATELIVNDKVAVIAGFGLTPLALAVGPVATQAKVPAVIMAAGTSMIVERSPFFVRTSFTLPQNTTPMAEWSAKNGIKKVVTLVSDYGPGLDAEKAFKAKFEADGGEVLAQLRAPLMNPEFAAFLQRAKDLKPDALFLFVPSGQGASLMKQVNERELAKAGIKIIGTGDVTDDDQINGMGDALIGMITSHNYSAAHDSPENKAFVAAFLKANNNMRPNFMAVGGYDGMHLIYKALEKTSGATDGAKLVEAMKGMAWTSPRGPMSIDPQTRDVVQNVYIREVKKVDGQLWNVEFATIANVKDNTHPTK
ncbi:MAG: ABC transporter substrate-binding protein [Beijerinckiaceae bacterium]|jgi:branched-chain amino acid transport system substrate-binding protein|nr:ABC transporter substrate-binding protein [Beijerinckiaceae bacterium]